MKYLSMAIILMVVAIGLSAASNSLPPELYTLYQNIPYADKFLHFFLVGGANGAAILYFSHRIEITPKVAIIITTIAMALATCDEFLQRMVPFRTFDLKDLAANYGGIMIFALVAMQILSVRNRLHSEKRVIA